MGIFNGIIITDIEEFKHNRLLLELSTDNVAERQTYCRFLNVFLKMSDSTLSKEISELLEQLVKTPLVPTSDQTQETIIAQTFEKILMKLHHLTALEDEIQTTRPLVDSLRKKLNEYEVMFENRVTESENIIKVSKEKTHLLEEQVHSTHDLLARIQTVLFICTLNKHPTNMLG